jgi:hypothetical protein
MLAQVANGIEDIARWLRANDLVETDIRLQFFSEDSWYLHSGDASYDTDHSGYWGAVVLTTEEYDATELAQELIDQATEHCAQVEE